MKRLLSLAAFALALSLVGGMFTPNVQTASAANNAVDQFANVELPPDLGQASIQVFVPETGHTLRGYFLDYWRANGGQAVYGDPISEPFASADGLYSQAFEKGVFQFRLELVCDRYQSNRRWWCLERNHRQHHFGCLLWLVRAERRALLPGEPN